MVYFHGTSGEIFINLHKFARAMRLSQQFTHGVVSEGVFVEMLAEVLRKICGNFKITVY